MNGTTANGENPSGGANNNSDILGQFSVGQSSSGGRTNHAAWLMAELASAKTQEQCLVQILSRCSHVLNKLKVEELQLKALATEERRNPGSTIQNGLVMSPGSILSVNSVDQSDADDNDNEDKDDEESSSQDMATTVEHQPSASLLANETQFDDFPGWQ